MEVSDIAHMLSSRISDLAVHCLPGGQRSGHEYFAGSIAGERGGSLAVRLTGSKQGVWRDFNNPLHQGDALDLVAWCLFQGDKKQAVAWAKSWLGIDGMDPARLKQQRAQIQIDVKNKDAQAKRDCERRTALGREVWHNAQKNITGTPVDWYLRGRAIDIRALPKLPGALRYAASIPHPDGTKHPGMVACIVNHLGEVISAHRTFLQVPMPGAALKADVEKSKLALGGYKGGYIPLNRGKSGRAIKDAPEGDIVVLAEGIETGLSIAMMSPEYRCLAAVSISNFASLILPPAISTVVIAVDNDGDNQQSIAAIEAAIAYYSDQGRVAYTVNSPVGKDFNDYLQSSSKDGALQIGEGRS